MKYVVLIGRLLYSLIFLSSAFNHIINYDQLSHYTAALGVPFPKLVTLLTGIMILLGGLSILLGYKVRFGAALLFVFLLSTAFIAHAFWGIEEAMQAQMQEIMFMKNLSMAGAALVFYYFGTGPLSLEKQSE